MRAACLCWQHCPAVHETASQRRHPSPVNPARLPACLLQTQQPGTYCKLRGKYYTPGPANFPAQLLVSASHVG
jgi:hypothetical protein